MKVIKHLSGILLATLGTAFVLASISLFFDQNPEVPMWGIAIAFLVLGLLPLFGAFLLLTQSVLNFSAVSCPKCGGAEHAPTVLPTKRNFWMMHLGGWLLGSLWGTSRGTQVRCTQCDGLYSIQTKGTRIAGILLWVVILLMLLGTFAEHIEKHL
jgi:hypothetical protein